MFSPSCSSMRRVQWSNMSNTFIHCTSAEGVTNLRRRSGISCHLLNAAWKQIETSNKGNNMPCKGLISSSLLNSRQDDTRVCRAVSLALVSPSIWKDGTVQWTPVNTLGKTETVQRMIRSTCANCAFLTQKSKKTSASQLCFERARWLSLWYTPIGRYQSCP
jgi:hypothetical protein